MQSQVALGSIAMHKASGDDGIPVELFQILKDDAVKVLQSYASKFGKLSSGCRTENGQFSFQSQRKAMPENVHTTAQLHSSHMLAKQCSKFSKPDFNSTWTVNFWMFKVVLEKAEEPEIKLPHPLDHWKSKRIPEKHLLLLYWLCQSLLLCGSLQTVENSERPPYPPPEKSVCCSGINS